MRALVLGAAGMLGRDLVACAPADVRLTARDRAGCDVTDPEAVARAIDAAAPDWVLNAAAYTAVDRAEAARAEAMRLNGDAPGVIGRAAAAAGIRVLQPSTDYVFPGTGDRPWREDDAPDPVNWYGTTKLAGERALAASGAQHLVVRVQWLYGAHGTSFPRTMLARARAGQATRVVDDQQGAPTPTDALASGLWTLVQCGAEGTLHVAAGGVATWYEVAARIFAWAGRPGLVTPCASADYPTPARRPANGVLDTSRAAALGVALPPWRAGLETWLAARSGVAGTYPNE
ncbi:MAG: dTDP-4-dehydrorhamnose reductase [Gemmatimonadota bacterium]